MNDEDSNPSAGQTLSTAEAMRAESEIVQNGALVESVRRLYVIESAGVYLALDDAFSCGEVVAEPRVYPLPGCSVNLLGICHQRGDIVPIYDLESLLSLKQEDNGDLCQKHKLEVHSNVHYLPVNRKLKKSYVVIMGASETQVYSTDAALGQTAGSIGFSLSAPPKSLLMDEDIAVDSQSMESDRDCPQIQGLMRDYIKSVVRYPNIELPVIQVDWLGYCLAQVKALEEVEG